MTSRNARPWYLRPEPADPSEPAGAGSVRDVLEWMRAERVAAARRERAGADRPGWEGFDWLADLGHPSVHAQGGKAGT